MTAAHSMAQRLTCSLDADTLVGSRDPGLGPVLLPPISVPLSTLTYNFPDHQSSSCHRRSLDTSTFSGRTLAGSSASTLTYPFHQSLPLSRPQTTIGFLAFAQLAPEIRHLVWIFALPSNRSVPIQYNCDPGTSSKALFVSSAAAPTILAVCRESRNIALRYYTRPLMGLSCITPSNIYLDVAMDTLYFPNTSRTCRNKHDFMNPNQDMCSDSFTHFMSVVTLLSPFSLQQIRRLAIHKSAFVGTQRHLIKHPMVENHLRWFWWQICSKFTGVEEVTITDCEARAVQGFGCEQHGEDISSGICISSRESQVDYDLRLDYSDNTDMDDDQESLFDVTLRTYWDLRKKQPLWKPPHWRVWDAQFDEREGTTRMNTTALI